MDADRRSGFMLLEVLVAAVVAAVLITLLTRLAGDNRHRVVAIAGTSGAMAVARSVLEEMSDRDRIEAGERRGTAGDFRWVVVTDRLDDVAPEGKVSKADQEGGDGSRKPIWTLYRIGVAVEAPDGRRTTLETHRLGRRQDRG
ncbi:hypothetical protein [Pinisolibacter sp.]|uniref:hypothetical protein n=1 Tax=Pinisolibacter sp. TaxID=2172024 RepID=UPI002FDEB7AD